MSSFFNTLLSWCERQIMRCPWTLLLLSLLLCGASLPYTLKNLEINTNTAEMLSPDLPFQQNQARLNQAFPQDADTIIFVVDAATPEETSQAAGKLAEQLDNAKDRFDSVYIPTDNAFFQQQSLLYLDQNDLDKLAKKLTDAQPFIGHLAQNYHLEGLFGIIGQALNRHDNSLPMNLNPILIAIDDTLKNQLNGQSHYLSWQNILAENKPNTDDYKDAGAQTKFNRTIVIAKPKMHFDEMLPADVALSAAREISRAIMAENPSLSIRITGETALEHEELESVSKGAAFAGLLSLILVCVILITPEKDQNNPENLKEFATQVQTINNTISGLPIINQAGGDAVVKAFIQAFSGAFIAIVVLLLLMYRSVRKTLLVVMPLLLAALLTGATNVLLDNPFNFANIIALPLLLGIGIDSSILIMHRHHSIGEDENLLQSSTTRGIIFSSVTTLCSFSSLAFTAHQGMASMGLLLAIGLTFTVMCSLIVLPAFSGKSI
ncbi:MMPL family transporter [Methylobacter sp. G7]|uniref:MMPL family transporter n=1 Tax=Methylobacter sp. G7 TaxID=3230117 RepID=UPI003D801EE0